MKTFRISPDCMACGACFTQTDLIVENDSGFAEPAAGKFISDNDIESAEAIVSGCPVGAISIDEVKSDMTATQLADKLENKLKNITPLKLNKKDFKFDSEKYAIKPRYSGAINVDDVIDYRFSSKSAANDAAVREFDTVYNQLDVLIREALGKYKADKLVKFYSLDEHSVFAVSNREYEKVLKEIYSEALSSGIKLPKDFCEFNVMPEGENNMLPVIAEFEMLDSAFRAVKDEFTYNKDSYIKYIYIDSEDRVVGSGFFGDKFKRYYGYDYNDMWDAVKEFTKDLNYALHLASGYVGGAAYTNVEASVARYNYLVETEIKNKVNMLRNK